MSRTGATADIGALIRGALPSGVKDVPGTGAVLVRPINASEVARVLGIAAETKTRVLPRGTSDVRGTAIVLDLSGLTEIHEISEVSLVAHADAGIRVRDLEVALRDRGFTLGFPMMGHLDPKLGGFLCGQGWAEASVLYGKPYRAAIGIEGVLPNGRAFKIKPAPRRAVGPDLSELFLGAEGRLGILTSAWVTFHPQPRTRMIAGAAMPSLGVALRCAARMVHDGLRPAFGRIHARLEGGPPAVLVVGFEGEARLVEVFHAMAVERIRDRSGEMLSDGHELVCRPVRSGCMRPEAADHLTVSTDWAGADGLVEDLSAVFGSALLSVRISDLLHEGCAATFTARVDRSQTDEQLVLPVTLAVERARNLGATVIAHHGPFATHRGISPLSDPAFDDLLTRLASNLDPSGVLEP